MDRGRHHRRLAPLRRRPPARARNRWRIRHGVRLRAELGALGGPVPAAPGVRKVALRRLRDSPPSIRWLLRQHLGVVGWMRGGGGRDWIAIHVRRAQGAVRGYLDIGSGRPAQLSSALGKAMRQRNPMGYFGIRILTISPGAWPWATTRLHFRRRRWSCPEGESFPSWTLRPPQSGRPSFSCLPQSVGEPLLPLPSLRGKSAPQSHRTMSPTTPGIGNSFELP